MKNTITIFNLALIGCIIIGCKQKSKNLEVKDIKNNQELINDISQLVDSLYTVDQNIQLAHIEAIQSGKKEKIKELALEQKRTFKRHIPILKEIYNQIGYPTIERVGKESSTKFFTMIQHAGADVAFQEMMLDIISTEVKKGNVNGKDFAFLTDRVKLVQQQVQVYGTQVEFNTTLGQVYPKPLIDSINVNTRRKEIGLKPLENYLNKVIKMHFKMNKAHYDKIGILEPKLYPVN